MAKDKKKKPVKSKGKQKEKKAARKKSGTRKKTTGKSKMKKVKLKSSTVILTGDEFRECPKCGHEIERIEKICPNCDVNIKNYEMRLESDHFCPSCHDPVLEDEDVCPFCNTKFERCVDCSTPVLSTERDCPECGRKLDFFIERDTSPDEDSIEDLFDTNNIDVDSDDEDAW